MHSALYLAFVVTVFHKNKCSYVFRNNKLNRISDNIEMLVKPIKKISGIFPNHEFELQFDLEHLNEDRSSRQTNYQHPAHSIMRSKNIPKVLPASVAATPEELASVSQDTTIDPDNQIVYMKDLKNALDEFAKKYVTEDCIKKELTTVSPNLLSNFNDNPALSDVLQLIKRGAKLQNDIPKGDSDLNWIKIRVPTA